MSNYTKATAFTAKDSLPSGNPSKIVKGTEFDTEFDAIATAIATKADTASPTFTGTPAAPTAAVGTNTTQVATTAFVQTAIPTGVILPYGGTSAPSGYLLTTGQAVSRVTYATLFAVIGTTYGAGDGSTTFNVPNMTNRVPVGAGGLYSSGATGGSKDAVAVAHTHTASSVVTDPGHLHGQGDFDGTNLLSGGGLGVHARLSGGAVSGNTTSATTGITVATTVDSAGVSGTDANMQPYLATYFIIKT